MSIEVGQWKESDEMSDVIVDSYGYVIAEHVSIDDKSMMIAAPDMYLALRGLLDAFDKIMPPEGRGALYVAAANAISKAQGQ